MPKKRNNSNSIEPTKKLHIFCEGEKTEPLYLQAYLEHFYGSKKILEDTIKIKKTNKNTAVALVNEAKKLKHSSTVTKNDEYWVVYDRESIAKYPEKYHKQAYDLAKSNNVNVALSNVCFEIWILLHLGYTTASYTCFEDLKRNSNLQAGLTALGMQTKYDKGSAELFKFVKSKIPDAITNAKRVNAATLRSSQAGRNKPYQLNPYTDIYKLFEAIEDFIKTK